MGVSVEPKAGVSLDAEISKADGGDTLAEVNIAVGGVWTSMFHGHSNFW